ncbi:MAG TPA: radical SAM protein [Elusimicrobiota bacterium]|nr:radical SAM protein [Elusimicrobiota bacterium]
MRTRDRLVAECLSMGARAHGGNPNKIHAGPLSPGCRLCAEGKWSCLFMGRFCRRGCFFCLQSQREKKAALREKPTGFRPRSAEEYREFVRRAGYRGVAFSGGEPLWFFDELIEYVTALRKGAGPRLAIWVYTSGDFMTERRLRELKSAGVDELRFNIAARNYSLTALSRAAKHFENVTVEIPAIPEDTTRLLALLPRLRSAGVKYLNLHQLTASAHNSDALARRGYRIHKNGEGYPAVGPVVESELAALRLLREGLASGPPLPIHYCSARYKELFQARAHRQRLAEYFTGETAALRRASKVTSAGYLRRRVPDDGRRTVPSKVCYLDFRSPADSGNEHGVFSRGRIVKEVPLKSAGERRLFEKFFLSAVADESVVGAILAENKKDSGVARFLRRFENLEYLPVSLDRYC